MKDTTALEDALIYQPRLKLLSRREVMVMEYMLQGYNNKEIAAGLGIVEGTVDHHLQGIRNKFHARGTTREQLVAIYLATRET